MAEYLLAEVLERQSDEVRRLLLRTSVLERVNGELADLLTGQGGGERVLQELEEANAFVVSLDAGRFCSPTCFRLQACIVAEPGQVAELRQVAPLACWAWDPVERSAKPRRARDSALAARLLSDHWPGPLPGEAQQPRSRAPGRVPSQA